MQDTNHLDSMELFKQMKRDQKCITRKLADVQLSVCSSQKSVASLEDETTLATDSIVHLKIVD